jgi:hypothetical protein
LYPLIARAGDFAGLGVVPRVDIWIIELRVIEEVEEFCAKLQIAFREMELRTAGVDFLNWKELVAKG